MRLRPRTGGGPAPDTGAPSDTGTPDDDPALDTAQPPSGDAAAPGDLDGDAASDAGAPEDGTGDAPSATDVCEVLGCLEDGRVCIRQGEPRCGACLPDRLEVEGRCDALDPACAVMPQPDPPQVSNRGVDAVGPGALTLRGRLDVLPDRGTLEVGFCWAFEDVDLVRDLTATCAWVPDIPGGSTYRLALSDLPEGSTVWWAAAWRWSCLSRAVIAPPQRSPLPPAAPALRAVAAPGEGCICCRGIRWRLPMEPTWTG
jgi:hypothetical protein